MSTQRSQRSLGFILAGVLTLLVGVEDLRAEAVFAPVLEGTELIFPRDSGAHPDYRTEWWYITGWLDGEGGSTRGFQVTFFRVATGLGADNPSLFAPRQLILAHAAIADPSLGRLLHAQRVERALGPLAGAAIERTHAWIGDWELVLEETDDGAGDRYRTRIDTERFSFELRLMSQGPPLLNGRAGFSQKTPDPKNASHYYSRPQLAVSGRVSVEGVSEQVTGHAWLDHEWSSEIMPQAAQGWDWIGINLHDGGSLMAFQMRRGDDTALWSAGTLREGQNPPRILAPAQVTFTALRRWQSPRTGALYPVEWSLSIDGRDLSLRPFMDDQELDGQGSSGIVYWEGAVTLFDGDLEIGRGYLEMTGYLNRPQGL